MTWIARFLKTLNCFLVFFVESQEWIDKFRPMCSFPERVEFRILHKDDWNMLSAHKIHFWETQLRMGADEKDLHKSFMLGALWSEKMHFVRRAIEENPFKSDKFIWCDAGIMRTEEDAVSGFLFGCEESVLSNDRFHLLRVGPHNDEDTETKWWIPKAAHHVRFGGGILGAHANVWLQIIPLYEQIFKELVADGVCVFKDQVVWANVVKRFPHLFHIVHFPNAWFHFLHAWSVFPNLSCPTFIINLASREDRWKECRDVWTLDEQVFRFPALRHGMFSSWLNVKVPHGCAASHLSLLACAKGNPLLVLEDDANPTKDVTLQFLRQCILQRKGNWDLINFGTSTLSGLHNQTFGAVRPFDAEFLQTRISSTTHCIGYNGSMLKFVVKACTIVCATLFNAQEHANIDFVFGSGTVLPSLVQLVPAKCVFATQRDSPSDLSSNVTNYDFFFELVNLQLNWLQHSWMPCTSPIVVKLLGGLGNQLFQAAAGLAFSQQTGRAFALLRGPVKNPHSSVSYLDTIFKHFPQLSFLPEHMVAVCKEDNKWNEDLNLLHVPPHRAPLLDGYFQRASNVTETFKSMLHLPLLKQMQEMEPSEVISVHVRGGDFKTTPLHNVNLDMFYKQCLSLCGKQQPLQIFTNDAAQAKRQFLNAKIMPQASEEEDLCRMATNRGPLVCANSTFSWWAAALSPKPRLVFLPQKWFAGTNTPNTKHLLALPGAFVV